MPHDDLWLAARLSATKVEPLSGLEQAFKQTAA